MIFNALIIIALMPLALRGVRYRPIGAARLLPRNLLIYGLGGIIAPFIGIKIDRPDHHRHRPGLKPAARTRSPCSPKSAPPSSRRCSSPSCWAWAIRWRSPASPSLAFPYQADGSLVRDAGGQVIGSALIAQAFAKDEYLHPRPSAAGNGYDPTSSGGSNYGPLDPDLAKRVAGDADALRKSTGHRRHSRTTP